MNKKHQATIKKLLEQLGKIKAEVEKMKDELQRDYDKLSVEAQYSEYGEELENALESLDSALCDGIEMAEDELFNVSASLEQLPKCDRGEEEDEEDDWDVSASAAGGGLFFGLKAGRKEEKKTSSQPVNDPFDTHWESSFDWKDENNDGYDDRDDGFWVPNEF